MKVIVVGGGFGGLKTAINLSKSKHIDVTLISDQDYFLMHATMYSTATGRDDQESVIPIEDILVSYPSIKFVKDKISKIDGINRQVQGVDSSYHYDQLVLAVGVVNQFYGNNAKYKYSYGVSSLQSVRLFSKSFHEMIVSDRNENLHCAVIGGGMVGVELVGALSDYVDRISLAHRLRNTKVKLTLIESADRILPSVSRTASQKITKYLMSKGVDVVTGQYVEKINRSNMIINGHSVLVDMTVWTLGGVNNPLFAAHPDLFKLSKKGKVIVNQFMCAYPNIYVIGDNADAKFSGTATRAIRDGIAVSRNLQLPSLGKPMKIVRSSRTSMLSVPITRFWAYVEQDGVYASGFLGSLIRRIIELDLYCHYLSLPISYKIWRRYRKSSEFCKLCKTQD